MTMRFSVTRRRVLFSCGTAAALVLTRSRPALADPVPRVVTVGGALTEIIYRLGVEKWLVATDTTSTYPAAALALPKVGYQRTLSAEGLLALDPTLLLATADAGPPAVLQQLQSAGVRTVRANGEHSFDGLVTNVDRMAGSLGVVAEGSELVRRLRDEWKVTRAAIRGTGAPPRVLFVLSHAANNVQVAGEGTAADAMIRLSGGVNALHGFNGYRPLSPEAAIAAAPDFIMVTREGIEALGGTDALLARPGLALTPAGQARRVIAPDALYLLGFGPRLPQAVRELAQGLGTVR